MRARRTRAEATFVLSGAAPAASHRCRERLLCLRHADESGWEILGAEAAISRLIVVRSCALRHAGNSAKTEQRDTRRLTCEDKPTHHAGKRPSGSQRVQTAVARAVSAFARSSAPTA
jgi:hypothetical protein